MSSAERAADISSGQRRAAVSVGTRSGDLAARLRAAESRLRDRLEHRTELLDLTREVNSTLQPEEIAELLLHRALGWVPAPCWTLSAFDSTGKRSLLAERGVDSDMMPVVDAVSDALLRRDEVFLSADVAGDSRTRSSM